MKRERSFRRRLTLAVIGWLIYGCVRLFSATYRYRVAGDDSRQAAAGRSPTGSFCLALWHEHLFAAIVHHRGQKFAPLASHAKDAEIAMVTLNRFGYRTIRGSSSRGGAEARSDLVAVVNDGWFPAITMDGPRGPRRQLKGGIVDVARRSQNAIVPHVAIADRQWVLRTWDQFKLPKPFARVLIQYGEPIDVPADTQGESFGAVKEQLREGMAKTEAAAEAALAAWTKGGAS